MSISCFCFFIVLATLEILASFLSGVDMKEEYFYSMAMVVVKVLREFFELGGVAIYWFSTVFARLLDLILNGYGQLSCCPQL